MRPSAAVSGLIFIVAALIGIVVGAVLQSSSHDPTLFVAPTVTFALIGGVLAASVKVVAQWERMIVLRLGRFSRVAEPGLRLVIPVIDTTIFMEMRVQTMDISRQQGITADNVPVMVNGVIFFTVIDPATASLKVENYKLAMYRMAQATLRDAVGRLTLDELLSHQDRLEAEIARNVATASGSWGLLVSAIKLEEIDVPEELKKMMSRQASSEREKRATMIKAEGDRMAASALAEAAATMAQSPGAMQLRILQSVDGLGPSSSNTVVLALPFEVLDALRSYGSHSRKRDD